MRRPRVHGRLPSSTAANIRVVRRFTSIGKTPTIKELARRLDSDVLFVLDADTLLESDTYIERVVEELYQGVGIASAWGSILPLRERDRRAADESPAVQWFADAHPSHEPVRAETLVAQARLRHHEHLPRGALPLSSARRLSRPHGDIRNGVEPGGLRRGVPARLPRDAVRHRRTAARRRPDELRGHLHRARDAQRGLPERPGPRRPRPHGRARGAAPSETDVPVVVCVPAVGVLLRRLAEKPLQGIQAKPHGPPHRVDRAAGSTPCPCRRASVAYAGAAPAPASGCSPR